MLELSGQTILAVTAHPGDLERYFGGTVIQLARANNIIHVIATAGEKGTRDPRQTERELAAIRRHEQLAAAALTGVRETLFLELPDGDLAYGSLPLLRVRLYRLLRDYAPQTLITFDPGNPYEPHPDHRATAQLTFEAALLHVFPKYLPEAAGHAEAAMPGVLLFFGANLPEPFGVNEIEAEFPAKLRALRCHASQAGEEWDTIAANQEESALVLGRRIGVKYGEPFRRFVWNQGAYRPAGDELRVEAKAAKPAPRPTRGQKKR